MWLTKFYPELSLLESNAERRDVMAEAGRRMAIDWPRVGIHIAILVGGVILLSTLGMAARLPYSAVFATTLVLVNLGGLYGGYFFYNLRVAQNDQRHWVILFPLFLLFALASRGLLVAWQLGRLWSLWGFAPDPHNLTISRPT